jgi:hypothetical protein
MKRLLTITTLALVGLATASTVQAAPPLHGNVPMAIDRFVEIFRPWELVGPPVDPNGPLSRVGSLKLNLEPEPAPWRAPQLQVTGY